MTWRATMRSVGFLGASLAALLLTLTFACDPGGGTGPGGNDNPPGDNGDDDDGDSPAVARAFDGEIEVVEFPIFDGRPISDKEGPCRLRWSSTDTAPTLDGFEGLLPGLASEGITTVNIEFDGEAEPGAQTSGAVALEGTVTTMAGLELRIDEVLPNPRVERLGRTGLRVSYSGELGEGSYELDCNASPDSFAGDGEFSGDVSFARTSGTAGAGTTVTGTGRINATETGNADAPFDGCPNDPDKTSPGVCGCGTADVDTDGDGTADCSDLCPDDSDKNALGQCGCGTPDDDSDGDGTPDCVDQCPDDPDKTVPLICGCGEPETDGCQSDGDDDEPTNRTPVADAGNDRSVLPGVQITLDGTGSSDPDGDELTYAWTQIGGIAVTLSDPEIAEPAFTSPAAPGPLTFQLVVTDPAGRANSDTVRITVTEAPDPTDPPEPDADGDGTPDADDGCPDDPNKTEPGDCGCGTPDTDTDSDGTADCNDDCPNDASKTEPGMCGCGTPDTDTDGDGAPDCNDDCPDDANKTDPGICGCGTPDTDTDGDGRPDCDDNCPNDSGKVQPGICGCGTPDTDIDGDGTPDCDDDCPNDPDKTEPGECGCGAAEIDSDGDGTLDCNDECPNDSSKVQPGTCGCGVADTDTDGDSTPDCNDNCPSDPNKTQPGTCGCGVPDTDTDGDGTCDCNDGCPNDAAKTAPGLCGCGVADTDTDSDGTPNCNDGCPNDASKTEPGTCGCGVPDTDTDSDSIADCIDQCADTPSEEGVDTNGCSCSQLDNDADGVNNCDDNCPDDANKTEPGICGCGLVDSASCGPDELTINLGGGVMLTMVKMPAGSFEMGDLSGDGNSNERPAHTVTFSQPFYMGQTEVTQAQWQAVMGTSPWSGQDYTIDQDTAAASYVSWEHAQALCDAVQSQTGYVVRLPSEAEWEYACRAGTTTEYSFGDDESRISDYAWWYENAWEDVGERYAHAVGQLLPNPWGLYDMHGNLWEWCEDCWHDDYTGAPVNGDVWSSSCNQESSYRVLRGGAWFRSARDLRSTFRGWGGYDDGTGSRGFRLALD